MLSCLNIFATPEYICYMYEHVDSSEPQQVTFPLESAWICCLINEEIE